LDRPVSSCSPAISASGADRSNVKPCSTHNVRAWFLTSGGSLTLFEQLRLWLRNWDDIENLVADQPAPWLASVTRTGIRIFDTR